MFHSAQLTTHILPQGTAHLTVQLSSICLHPLTTSDNIEPH